LQRKQIKALMRDWERLYPGRVESIFRSLQDVRPSHLLDTELFNFNEITRAVDGVED
jgi:tRNA 2-thiocytidine biosynthesis protein TtcA